MKEIRINTKEFQIQRKERREREERYTERESQGETERQNKMGEVDSTFSALDYK